MEKIKMPDPGHESFDETDALNRLSHAMEQLQTSYARSQRANRQIRVALVVVLVLLGGVVYHVTSPILELVSQIPQLIPQLQKAELDPEEAMAERQRLRERLSPEQQASLRSFEEDHEWMASYLEVYPEFSAGATISLRLSQMSNSIKVMPDLYEEVRNMSTEVQAMSDELRTMNGKMDALPLLATDVRAMNFHMSVMSRSLDSTMGETGRMLPWSW